MRERQQNKSVTFPAVSAFCDIKTFLNQHPAKVKITREVKDWCNTLPVDIKGPYLKVV
jgi:hypothetical protein